MSALFFKKFLGKAEASLQKPLPSASPHKLQPAENACQPDSDFITLPLAAITEALSPEVRFHLAGIDLAPYNLRLPLAVIDPMVRQGRIVVEWKLLRTWLNGIVPVPSTLNPRVELPLPLVIPLLVSAGKLAVAGKRPPCNTSIPNLFMKAPASSRADRASAAAPSDPRRPEPQIVLNPLPQQSGPPTPPAPPGMPAAPSVPIARNAPVVEPLRLQTEFRQAEAPSQTTECAKRAASAVIDEELLLSHQNETPSPEKPAPREIVSQACNLPDVAGSFIGTHDGFFVAGHTPGISDRILTAFAPSLFTKFDAYMQLSKLDEPQSILVTLPEASLQVFRCGEFYFGALSQSGRPLPSLELSKLAARLQTQKT